MSESRDALAAAGLADEAERLAPVDGEGHILNGGKALAAEGQIDPEVLDLGEAVVLSCSPRPCLGIEDVAQAIAEQVQSQDRHEDSEAWKDRDPWRRGDLVAGIRQHAAPTRR